MNPEIQPLFNHINYMLDRISEIPHDTDERANYFCEIYKYVISNNQVLEEFHFRNSFVQKFFQHLFVINEFVTFIPDMIKLYILSSQQIPLVSNSIIEEYMNLDEMSKMEFILQNDSILFNNHVFEDIVNIIKMNIINKNNRNTWIEKLATLCSVQIRFVSKTKNNQ